MTKVIVALIALLALAGLSWALSSVGGPVVALSIAVVKAAIVLSVFMELGEAGAAARLVVLVAVAFIALLSLGTVADVAFR